MSAQGEINVCANAGCKSLNKKLPGRLFNLFSRGVGGAGQPRDAGGVFGGHFWFPARDIQKMTFIKRMSFQTLRIVSVPRSNGLRELCLIAAEGHCSGLGRPLTLSREGGRPLPETPTRPQFALEAPPREAGIFLRRMYTTVVL